MVYGLSDTANWRRILASGGLLVTIISLAFLYFPTVFVGAGLSLLGVGELINVRGKAPQGLSYGDRRARHPETLQRLGKVVAIIGGILLAEGAVKLFALVG